MNDMNYWKLLGTTAILMTALCVGIYFYAKWDVQRFKESLGKPYTPAQQKIEPTANFTKQALPETPTILETETGSDLERQQEVKPEITDTAGEDGSLDEFSEFLDRLGDKELAALLENPDTTDTETETSADLLQEQIDNFLEKGSGLIVIDELEVTQASDWIEIGIEDLRSGDIIDLKGLGDGNYVIIDKTGVMHRTE
ncbi:hypothetical protein C6503_20225 [Candidatus Poribacteria bacterium]|nr:MAG: hypothetical protein C6503_20225 [Candidatus Poribacteria bacterium]